MEADAHRRFQLMKELVLQGRLASAKMTDSERNDLFEWSVLHLIPSTTGVSSYPAEPLVIGALFEYLEEGNSVFAPVSFMELLEEWTARISWELRDALLKEQQSGVNKEKGLAAEFLIAVLLKDAATVLNSSQAPRPITDHALFGDLKDTYLSDYTLSVSEIVQAQEDPNRWEAFLGFEMTREVLLPHRLMGPDVLAFLVCLPGTESYRKYGPHNILLSACSKNYGKASPSAYISNFQMTDIWKGFTCVNEQSEDDEIVKYGGEYRERLEKVLKSKNHEIFKRALRITFAYTPYIGSPEGRDPALLLPGHVWAFDGEAIHLNLDYLNERFKSHLQERSSAIASWLNASIDYDSTKKKVDHFNTKLESGSSRKAAKPGKKKGKQAP